MQCAFVPLHRGLTQPAVRPSDVFARAGLRARQVLKLNLDNCRASGGGVEGLSDDYTALRSLSLNNVELRSLVDFPKLPALKKVGV